MMPISATAPFPFAADFPSLFSLSPFLFSWELLVQVYRFDFDLAIAFMERGRWNIRIVTKDYDPVSLQNLRDQPLFCLQRLHRIQVVSHDPRQWNMVTCWKQNPQQDEGLASAGELYGLNAGVVAGDWFHGDPGKDLRRAID